MTVNQLEERFDQIGKFAKPEKRDMSKREQNEANQFLIIHFFLLDISVQGGKVHEVIPMGSTNPQGTIQRTATTLGNFTPYSFRIVCWFSLNL